MTVDQKFLRDIQAKGWLISSVSLDLATVSCPKDGCGLKVNLKAGTRIPEACGGSKDMADVPVRSYDDARTFLRGRREMLGLTIREIEEVAGAGVDHLAKAEKDNPSKIPNAQLLVEWAQSLGYEVVLRPAALPAMALRYITDSRPRLVVRRKMQPHHRARRAGAAQDEQE